MEVPNVRYGGSAFAARHSVYSCSHWKASKTATCHCHARMPRYQNDACNTTYRPCRLRAARGADRETSCHIRHTPADSIHPARFQEGPATVDADTPLTRYRKLDSTQPVPTRRHPSHSLAAPHSFRYFIRDKVSLYAQVAIHYRFDIEAMQVGRRRRVHPKLRHRIRPRPY